MEKDWKIIQLDENGDPVVMHLYDDKTGLMIEERVYRYKKLRNSRVYGEEETLLTIYHEHTDTPLVESRHHYTNNGKNQHNIHFDSNGNQYYSTRIEQLNELHQRRYSNDVLLVESIQNTQPPSYTYFYPNGTVLINYISHGD